jgi:tRNA threonylcarbamoyladenosine modification (KEOPS) complex  Pcc1 subunit
MAYNSYLPEIKKLNTKRSKVSMEKSNNLLLFDIECTDITAFRATISDIVSLGKIIESTKKLCSQ